MAHGERTLRIQPLAAWLIIGAAWTAAVAWIAYQLQEDGIAPAVLFPLAVGALVASGLVPFAQWARVGTRAALMAAVMTCRPSQPRKPSVRPPTWCFFSFQSATNLVAMSGFFTASGNQGVKNTRWKEPLAASPACWMSWSGELEPPVVMMRAVTCWSLACFRIRVIC